MVYGILGLQYFNPRSLAGATIMKYVHMNKQAAFQSTLPRGSDLKERAPDAGHYYFNPRSLAGATCFQNF